jgi:predicted small secreted protein
MKLLITLLFMSSVLTACNFKENLKEAGDGIQTGVQNAGEALKETPAAISETSNKVEADIKK